MTFYEHTIIKLSDLSYADVNDLAAWCRTAVQYDSPRHKVEQQAWRAKAAKADAARQAAAAPKAAKDARKLKWLKANLKEGHLLKMLGCRDGHGYREFIRWTGDDNLVCWQWEMNRNRISGHYKVFMPAMRGTQVTTHMADKVSKIQGVDGVFAPIPA